MTTPLLRASKAVQSAKTPIVSGMRDTEGQEIHRLIHISVNKSGNLSTVPMTTVTSKGAA
jgi:hypothetical protein